MAMTGAAALRFGIDRLEARGARVFGWGWIADPARPIADVALRVSGDGWQRTLPASFGMARDDVERAYPDLPHARASGFVVTGYAGRPPIRQLVLELAYAGGERREIDVTASLARDRPETRKWRELRWLAGAAWRRLRHGDLRGIVRRVRAQNYVAPSLDDLDIAATLVPQLPPGRPLTIVFDHNMGGGANHYRRTLIAERAAAGGAILLCTYNLPTLDYRLALHVPETDERTFRLSTFLVLEALFERVPVAELFVNSPVSFDEPLLFAEWIARLRREHPATRLVVTAHDHFSVCPSFVLLDADGRYCGVPTLDVCAQCLPRHRASYVTLSPPTTIPEWRASWGRCLAAADEIRCFSAATRKLIARGHPTLDPARLTIVPHALDYRPERRPTLRHAAPLTVGVFGNISPQKGALVVRDVLAALARDRPDARVVVAGTLDVAVDSPQLRVLGPYRREDMVGLIEAHGINMILFPSVCPETFSYVVEEMMLLRMPIVAFDLGAPGERLRGYELGRLCPAVDAAAALATMARFHDELAAREAAVAHEG
ncbi:MAG TPA: glycosyltransferase [Casimicrobiaceae bacterium]|nr:glycosyltransferase [Casimicrobiaceae bacterium]